MNKKIDSLKILSCIMGLLLVVSVFKNISYPLFWADEGMTAMCSERVVKYGYPKVHDGKNVVNDLYCNTPQIAVNAKDDAFIGGANWGQYYFGSIGYLLAAGCNDIYTKTGVYRSTFAMIGLLGLFLLAFVLAKFFEDKFYKYLFITLFLFAALISISLTLHIREVRYYSPALFLSSCIISLYIWYRFRKPFNKILYSTALAALLWLVFNMFSPLYFVFIATIGISEAVMGGLQYMKIKKVKESVMPCLPALIAIAVSYMGVYPLLGYFKTFEISKVLADFFHFNSDLYWQHFSTELGYFQKEGLLWLAIAMEAGILLNFKKMGKKDSGLFHVSNFLSLLFIVFLFSIPNVANPIYSRYVIYMYPVLSVIAIINFILLLNIFSFKSKKFWNTKVSVLVAMFTGFFGVSFAESLPFISGHIYEMTNQYKGPLDYTIPYIQLNYPKPENLIIAANYEESPYMYYLKSKVIIGTVGNNLAEDTLIQPDIIAYRQSFGSFFDKSFNKYLTKVAYNRIFFPIKDIPVNNIPELNFYNPVFCHYFKQPVTDNQGDETNLVVKNKLK